MLYTKKKRERQIEREKIWDQKVSYSIQKQNPMLKTLDSENICPLTNSLEQVLRFEEQDSLKNTAN